MGKLIILVSFLLSLGISSDVGVTKIFEPSGIIPPDNYNPRTQIKNFGGGDQNFWLFFEIQTISGSPVYFDSSFQTLSNNETKNVSFSTTWTADIGVYVCQCSLYLASDTNSDNNTLSSKVRVEILSPGQWILRDSVPAGNSGKKVKDGGGMVDGSTRGEHFLYVMKGNNTDEFYQYDVILGSWQVKARVPKSLENARSPKKGSRLYRSGDYVYLAKGNNTLEFWAYYIPDDSWTRLKDIPLGLGSKRIKAGSSLAEGRIDNKKYLFLLKGSGTREFYAYDTDLDTWVEKTATPYILSESKSKIKKGSCLVDDGRDIYLLKDKSNWLFFYDADSNLWYPRESLPFYNSILKRTKVKDGAAMVYLNGNPDIIYALKGGGNEFWCYSVEDDSWLELVPMPRPPSNKKVKGGSSLVSMTGGIFALKGGNTNEMFMYIPFDTLFNTFRITSANNNQQGNLTKLPLNNLPDFSSDKLMVYDAVGRKVRITRSQKSAWLGLRPGIYFIGYLNNKDHNFKKVLIIR
jgi:hypothetical protein